MNHSLILIPFAGMLLLTLAVFVCMFYRRIGAINASKIEIKSRADLENLPAVAVHAAHNFQNLFELPVIFYATVLALYITRQADYLHVICAFGFLLFRIAHSVIHCTYNHIMQRFAVYAIASVFLWIMVVRLTIGILHIATIE